MTEPLLDILDEAIQEAKEQYKMNPDPGYKPYTWMQVPGTKIIKPWCTPCDKPFRWAMEISKDYPKTVSKHTRSHHAHPVVYQGLLVQVWKCPGCGQSVVK